jgi:phospho-N-acetylmuramoyl-pentapeptide-transferase
MGGALILLALVTSTVLWADPQNTMVWLVTAVTALYGGVGYIDDARKIQRKSSGGLSGRYKLLLQFGVAFVVLGYLWYGDVGLPADWIRIRDRINVPFVAFERHPISLPTWLYVLFAAVCVVGTSNGVNLTDGLDGLAIGPVMISGATYGILAYVAGLTLFGNDVAEYLQIPSIQSAGELAIYCGALMGAGVGFLWYNKNELMSMVLGGIFVVETVSVIIQVSYFKMTKKRIFLMAPIHHHFEKKGWPEPRVIVRFWIISIMLAIASLATLKLR